MQLMKDKRVVLKSVGAENFASLHGEVPPDSYTLVINGSKGSLDTICYDVFMKYKLYQM